MNDEFFIDSHKLIFHPHRVSSWLASQEKWEKSKSVYPLYMELSPFGSCNHRCSFCALDFVGYKPHVLELDVMQELLPELGTLGIRAIMYGGEGEPLLHPDMAMIAKITAESGVDAALTTNGVKLNQKFVEQALAHFCWIKVSLNGGSAQTYAKVHGCSINDFDKVIKNLQYAVTYRQQQQLNCTIGAQILLIPETVNELGRLARICRDDIGLDYLVVKPFSQNPLSISHKYESLDYNQFLHLEDELEQYNSERFQVIFRHDTMRKHALTKAYESCNATPFFWAYIMANGDVYSCSAYLTDHRFCLGNINEHNFQKIWEGDKRQKNMALMGSDFDVSSCRKNCRMDAINRYLWQLKHPHPHVNFI